MASKSLKINDQSNSGKFVFYFASQAYYSEERDAFPLKGVKDYGDLVHKYGIPVTWLTNAEGAKRGKDVFTKFHEEFSDDVIMWGMPTTKGNTSEKRDYILKLSEDEIYNFLKNEQKEILKHLPFARVDHCGFFYRTPAAVNAIKRLGIKSVYGHCWELIATDGVTDNGVPWGMYFLDTEKCWKRPEQSSSSQKYRIVANEWLQHDLNKSWNYYGSCSVFSWDPNDVERAKICYHRNIDYWKEGFKEYYRNRLWNEFIPFVFHQEAHEQESTPGGWDVYPPETVQSTYEMTDEFLKYITSGEFPEMEISKLVDIVEKYRNSYEITPPTYMLFKDLPIKTTEWQQNWKKIWKIYQEAKKEEEDEGGSLEIKKDYKSLNYFGFPYGWQGFVQKPPGNYFPESFVSCDTECQLFFHRGEPFPIKIWDYLKDIDEDPNNLYFNEDLFQPDSVPKAEIIKEFSEDNSKGNSEDKSKKNSNETKKKHILFRFSSEKAFPYGIAIWKNGISNNFLKIDGELERTEFFSIKNENNEKNENKEKSKYNIRKIDNREDLGKEIKVIKEIGNNEDKLIFIRLNLPKGVSYLDLYFN